MALALGLPARQATASFGSPETQGLLRLRSATAVGLGTLSSTISHSYFYQDIGQGSRFHNFGARLGLDFGLGSVGQIGLSTRGHGILRFAAESDPELALAIGDSDFESGLGDSDLSLRLILPFPTSRLRLAGEAVVRLPTGESGKNLSAGTKDFELVGVLSIDLLRGTRFVPTRLLINAGQRVNRNAEGFGLPLTLDPAGWSTPFPPYYPPIEADETASSVRQNLFGVGVEFRGSRMTLFSELSLEHFADIGDEEMSLSENLWQLGLGFRMRGPWRSRLHGGFDINLSRDNFETEFIPHYPRLVTSFGLSWHWQVLAGDPDGDGIRGDDDLCPGRAEDFDGFEDGDGCPDTDNDDDGVPDRLDLAPLLPEDRDGFEDDDGRPDLDNDNDGIPDRDDLCPDRAEDFDGFEDADGCPDRQDPDESAEAIPAEGEEIPAESSEPAQEPDPEP